CCMLLVTAPSSVIPSTANVLNMATHYTKHAWRDNALKMATKVRKGLVRYIGAKSRGQLWSIFGPGVCMQFKTKALIDIYPQAMKIIHCQRVRTASTILPYI